MFTLRNMMKYNILSQLKKATKQLKCWIDRTEVTSSPLSGFKIADIYILYIVLTWREVRFMSDNG